MPRWYTPARMLGFIDQLVLPILTHLYATVGYLGVGLAMAIESAMIPLPSELVLPFAGFMVSDHAQIEPLTHAPWSFWGVVVVAVVGNTVGSLVAYAIGAWGGRPFLERYGRYLLIRHDEIAVADRFFARWGPQTAFFSRLLPVVRTFISFPAGVARMPLGRFILYSTLGAVPWTILLLYVGTVLGANWVDVRHALSPFDSTMAVLCVAAVVLFVAWRTGLVARLRRAA